MSQADAIGGFVLNKSEEVTCVISSSFEKFVLKKDYEMMCNEIVFNCSTHS
jgi:hypothetical protein